MIASITGKPGDGKSLFACKCLLDELIKSQRFIVTNLPLNFGYIQEYVSKRIDEPFDLDSRVRVLRDEDVYEFYRFRSGGLVLDESPDRRMDEASKRMPRAEFIENMKAEFMKMAGKPEFQLPISYYIDEAHDYFNSREWATNGRGLLYYASKHRHLHDDIYLITQVLDNVDKQLRGLISETHVVRNQLRRRVGPVRMRPVFRLKSYYGVPAGVGAKPYAETTFDLDLSGVARCYKTVGALGVHKTAEEKKNKGWLPWWTLPLGGVALVGVVIAAFTALPAAGGMMAKQVAGGGAAVLTGNAEIKREPPKVFELPTKPPSPAREVETAAKHEPKEAPLEVRGILRRGERVNVVLSDGRVLTEDDLELGRITRAGVYVAGKLIPMARIREKETTGDREKKPVEIGASVGIASQVQDEGSWVRGVDGVSRLKEQQTLTGKN